MDNDISSIDSQKNKNKKCCGLVLTFIFMRLNLNYTRWFFFFFLRRNYTWCKFFNYYTFDEILRKKYSVMQHYINQIYIWCNLNLFVILIHKHAILIYMLPVNICIIFFYSSRRARIIGRIILYFNYVIQTSVSCNCKLEISLSVFISWILKNYTYFFSLLPFFFFLILLLIRNCSSPP